jgi:hypothetical protein
VVTHLVRAGRHARRCLRRNVAAAAVVQVGEETSFGDAHVDLIVSSADVRVHGAPDARPELVRVAGPRGLLLAWRAGGRPWPSGLIGASDRSAAIRIAQTGLPGSPIYVGTARPSWRLRGRALKIGRPLRRALSVAGAGVLVVALTGCTGRGGGQLPPAGVFTGAASFGFSFSCEDKGGLNPPTGRLHIELSYTDHGTSPIGSAFSIHGIVDTIDPVLESEFCVGQNPPPGGNELIFLGRYYLTSSAPANFPSTCPTRETVTTPLCRFEVTVRDDDKNGAPSTGDSFSIMLSNGTALTSQLAPATVVYARAGVLSSGNVTVD